MPQKKRLANLKPKTNISYDLFASCCFYYFKMMLTEAGALSWH